MVFMFNNGYENGGLGDCSYSYDTMPEAMERVNHKNKNTWGDEYIFDRVEGKKVWDKKL